MDLRKDNKWNLKLETRNRLLHCTSANKDKQLLFTTVETVSYSFRFRQILVDLDDTFIYKCSTILTCTVLYCCIQHQTLLRIMMSRIQKNGTDSPLMYIPMAEQLCSTYISDQPAFSVKDYQCKLCSLNVFLIYCTFQQNYDFHFHSFIFCLSIYRNNLRMWK